MKSRPVTFAAVGDVHGAMHAMVRLLGDWEMRHRRHIDFVLQVGDFEPHRHHKDLDGASIPKQYRDLGDFGDFFEGRAAFDWPIYFIGGNHEPYGYLEQMPNGGRLIPNCHYLGRAGRIDVDGLTIVGVTGVHAEAGAEGRPPPHAFERSKKKVFGYFSDEDVSRAAAFGSADVLMLHGWPQGAVQPEQADAVREERRWRDPTQVGSQQARMLVERLNPKLIVAGHMHFRHRSQIGGSAFAAMGHIDSGAAALGVFEAWEGGQIVEVPCAIDRPLCNASRI